MGRPEFVIAGLLFFGTLPNIGWAFDANDGSSFGCQEAAPCPERAVADANGVPLPKEGKSGDGSKLSGGDDTKTPNGQNQQFAITGAQVGKAGDAATEHAQSAYKASKQYFGQAQYDNQMRAQLQQDQLNVNNVANPLLASPKVQDQARAKQFLSQRLSPPSKFAPAYEKLGLATNNDIMDKSDGFINNLYTASAGWEQAAKSLQMEGDQAMRAAAVMRQMQTSVQDKGKKLGALAPDSSSVSPEAITADIIDPISATGVSSLNPKALTPTSPADGGPLNGGKAAAGEAKSETPLSLRDQLRAKLAANAGVGAAGKAQLAEGSVTAPKSAFDSLFEKPASPAVHASRPAGEEESAQGAFRLAGSETDQAIHRLVQSLDSPQPGRDERTFGDPDLSLFKRMNLCLTKAQAEKKVGIPGGS